MSVYKVLYETLIVAKRQYIMLDKWICLLCLILTKFQDAAENVVMHINSEFLVKFFQYCYNAFQEKCSCQFAKKQTKLLDNINMLKFVKTKVVKKEIYGAKSLLKIWDVHTNNIDISELIETCL